MTDFDTIWRTQDEIRTVVDAAIGCGIWDIRYNSKREVVELELMTNLDEDAVSDLTGQFTVPCDYDGTGSRGSKFVFYL
jgi:hypothetical protein